MCFIIGMPPTKISRLRELMANGDWDAALSLAAKFPRLGDDGPAITRANAARVHSTFYRQLRHDPDALRAAGIAALKRRYGL